MDFSERLPSSQWQALKSKGILVAEVWFKPEENPQSVIVRLPAETFALPGISSHLTISSLVKALKLSESEIESWTTDEPSPSNVIDQPLAPPAEGEPHRMVLLVVKAPDPPASVSEEATIVASSAEIAESTWQFLEDRWKVIIGLESQMESLRMNMDGLRIEMDAAGKRSLSFDLKTNALNSDINSWTKAKSRIQFTIPKVRDYIHRASWAQGLPERKRLAEIYEQHVFPRVSFSPIETVLQQVEALLKNRQALVALGTTVYQEGKRISGECQSAYRLLEMNAAANASRKKSNKAKR